MIQYHHIIHYNIVSSGIVLCLYIYIIYIYILFSVSLLEKTRPDDFLQSDIDLIFKLVSNKE